MLSRICSVWNFYFTSKSLTHDTCTLVCSENQGRELKILNFYDDMKNLCYLSAFLNLEWSETTQWTGMMNIRKKTAFWVIGAQIWKSFYEEMLRILKKWNSMDVHDPFSYFQMDNFIDLDGCSRSIFQNQSLCHPCLKKLSFLDRNVERRFVLQAKRRSSTCVACSASSTACQRRVRRPSAAPRRSASWWPRCSTTTTPGIIINWNWCTPGCCTSTTPNRRWTRHYCDSTVSSWARRTCTGRTRAPARPN